MTSEMKRKIATMLTESRDAGRLTDYEVAETVDLLNIDHRPTASDRDRLRTLLDKCSALPPADPATTGFVNVRLRRRRPTVAAVDFYADVMRDAIDEQDATDAEKEAEFLKRLDAMQLAQHGQFFNMDKASIGSDAYGWIGFVAGGKRMVRSADVFDTAEQSAAWCQSSIDRFAGRQ